MDRFQRAEAAVEYRAKGCNCAQAVVMACADLTDADPEFLKKAAAGFGGGMGCMESTCGALVGANICLGIMKQGQGAVPAARKLLMNFKERSGAVVCKDLKGIETGKVLCACPDCVRNAVIALCETNGID